jgi:hypothetical protein
MVFMSIMTVGALSFTRLATDQQRSISSSRTLSERDLLVSRLGRIAKDSVSLTTTANDSVNQGPSNRFHDCYLGGASGSACDASACSTTSLCDVTLFDSAGNRVAGPPSNPQYYDLTGDKCTPSGATDNKCAIQAIAQYSASCDGGTPTCSIAKNVTIRFTVQQNPNVILAVGPTLNPVISTISASGSSGSGSTGTTGSIAKWVSSDLLGDSVMNEVSGSVGIGVTSPSAALDVNGSIKPGSATVGGACGSEGWFAYDTAAHSPVYCNSSGKWAKITGGGGSVIANALDPLVTPTVTIPAKTCTNAIRVDMQMGSERLDSPIAGLYKQSIFTILIDGASTLDSVLISGAKKFHTGAGTDTEGFNWFYTVSGIHKAFFISDVSSSHTLTAQINANAAVTLTDMHYSVSCM